MEKSAQHPFYKQVWHFIVHLRWHYQVFILSGGYLMGGFFQESMNWGVFGIQFLNVHLLLFGGATAYNSWWDKDEGAIGGLKHPPKMNAWMWIVSLLIQLAGLGVAFSAGWSFTAVYLLSMLFFWLYSTPLARWKGKPIRSLVAIGISTGTNSFLLGYFAAGPNMITWPVLAAAIGVALVILSLYPTSQIYQTEEDAKRGDRTFAVHFGKDAVFAFYRYTFSTGIALIALALSTQQAWVGGAFLVLGGVTGLTVNILLSGLSIQSNDYERVMRIKYGTSLAFVLFLVAVIILRHHLHLLFL